MDNDYLWGRVDYHKVEINYSRGDANLHEAVACHPDTVASHLESAASHPDAVADCQKKDDSHPQAEANDNSPRTDDNRRCPGAIGVDGGDSYAQSPS